MRVHAIISGHAHASPPNAPSQWHRSILWDGHETGYASWAAPATPHVPACLLPAGHAPRSAHGAAGPAPRDDATTAGAAWPASSPSPAAAAASPATASTPLATTTAAAPSAAATTPPSAADAAPAAAAATAAPAETGAAAEYYQQHESATAPTEYDATPPPATTTAAAPSAADEAWCTAAEAGVSRQPVAATTATILPNQPRLPPTAAPVAAVHGA